MSQQSSVSAVPSDVTGVPSKSGLIQRLREATIDKRRRASRPKLLFCIAAADMLAVVCSGALASWFLADGVSGFACAMETSIAALTVMAALHAEWSYSISSLRNFSGQFRKLVTASCSAAVLLAGLSYLAGSAPSPARISLWMIIAIAFLAAVRAAAVSVVKQLTQAGYLTRRTVIVGGGRDAAELIEALEADKSGSLQLLGVFDDRKDDRASEGIQHLTHLGSFQELSEFCRSASVDLLVVAVPIRAEERLLYILQSLFSLQADIRISALNSKLRLNGSAYTYIGKVPMLRVMDKPLSDWDRALKSIEDRVIGALLLILLSPIMALTALAVRLDSKGPALFKQKRFGFDNELIEVYKFRSMFTDMSDSTASKLVTKGDPRVTRVGRIIRRTSLDELPQLFNVMLGTMSLVGPRPHAVQAKAGYDLYQDVVQGYFARHRVKPGMTGWAQINGWRGETDTTEKIERRVEHDLYYIDNWSVLFDLYIIGSTPLSLMTSKNAY